MNFARSGPRVNLVTIFRWTRKTQLVALVFSLVTIIAIFRINFMHQSPINLLDADLPSEPGTKFPTNSYFPEFKDITATFKSDPKRHFLLDSKYVERSHSIISIFIHPSKLVVRDFSVLATPPLSAELRCSINGVIPENQRVLENPHRHTLVLVCPVPLSMITSNYSLLIWDEKWPDMPRISTTVPSVEPSGYVATRTKKHRLIACSSPLYGRGRFLMEWIEYHLMKGVDVFYLYGWKAEQLTLDIAQKYAADAKVVFVEYSLPLVPDQAHYQVAAQTHCLHLFGHNADWVVYVDVDEFVVPLGPYGELDLASAVDHIADESGAACVGSVLMRPLNFGPSETINRTDEDSLVIEHFTRAAASPKHFPTKLASGCAIVEADGTTQLRYNHYRLAHRARSYDNSDLATQDTLMVKMVSPVRDRMKHRRDKI